MLAAMKKTPFLLVAGLTALLAATVTADARTWTRSTDGAKIEGEFVRMKDKETAYLRLAGGRTVEVPVASLSDEDQAFISEKTGDPLKPKYPAGETTVVVSGAHLCCGGCREGVEAAVTGIEGLTVSIEDRNITLKGTNGELVKKGIDAIAKAGYYGISDHEMVKFDDLKATAEERPQDSITVSGVHLCCGRCVTAIDDVVAAIEGAKSHDAKTDAPSFTIKGENLKPSVVLAALREEGFNGTVK